MDLVGACRAFVHVSEKGSFTQGAAAARVPQPVASRRIAALEKHLGARLFDRSARRAVLTPFGRDMLPSARRLVRLAEAMEDAAEQARRTPLRVAVPDTCSTLDLARLDAEARRHGIHLDLHTAPPDARAELLRSQDVRAALIAVPPDEAAWRVPLGLASVSPPGADVVYIETLRVGRADVGRRPRRVWIQPEDDVPHIRDRVTRIRDAVGLRPAQVAVAHTLAAATAEILGSDDLLLASAGQAEELGLHWCPMGEAALTRGLDVATAGGEDPERLRTALREGIARCIGAVDRDGAGL
ncbi:LysR family transcriptional regulator [Allosalinactinospora lopnorensis]|uniref:LysR family transcriptional regulator n=1 Tax=Allosalinactinospora lopnorensis TaxID=1352348 RepID=UPI000623BCFE|nr:LysR family transcriptional regulator [Allosalinactinospora lopnorensis]